MQGMRQPLQRGCLWKLGFLTASSLSLRGAAPLPARLPAQCFSAQARYGPEHFQETEYAYHIKAPFAGSCVDVIAATTGLSADASRHLLEIGAVYHQQRSSPKAFRTVTNDIVQPGEYLRVHHKPRMFATSHIDWKAAVVAETEDYLVCHKPAGLPIHANVDNLYENVVTLLQKELGLENLHPSHRLDTDTSGIVVLAKTIAFQAWFSRQMQARRVRKTYKALLSPAVINGTRVDAPPPPVDEALTAYLGSSNAVPRVYTLTQEPQSREAKLVVRKTTPTIEKTAAQWREYAAVRLQDSTHGRARAAIDDWTSDKPADFAIPLLEADIELLTGRTHQIRGQMRLHGWHIAGDNMYEGVSSKREPDIYRSAPFLALQAHQIEFPKYRPHGGADEAPSTVSYSARSPWWQGLLAEKAETET
jgi:23S rRNA-/tRNA-specific pseudouridylate synthase